MPKRNQKTHEALDRVSPELTSQYSRDFWLIDPHELSRRCLTQLSSPDGPVDPNHQTSLYQVFASVSHAKVSEYVTRAGLPLK